MTTEQALRDALSELFALVMSECRQLLDEDSGGDSALYMQIQEALALPTAAPVDELPELPLLPEPDWYMVHTPGADFDWSFTKDRSEALELSRQSDGLPDVSKITSYYAGNRVLDYARASLQSVVDAVLAEREACAKVCEDLALALDRHKQPGPIGCAAAIRERGKGVV